MLHASILSNFSTRLTRLKLKDAKTLSTLWASHLCYHEKSEACAAHELAVQSIPLFDFQVTFRRWSFLQFLDKFHEFRHCLRGMESALIWRDWCRERRPPTCLCRRGRAVKDFLCNHRRLSTNGYKWYRSVF